MGGKKHKWRLRVPTTDSAHIWVQVLNDVAATATVGHHANASRWDVGLLNSRRALEHLAGPELPGGDHRPQEHATACWNCTHSRSHPLTALRASGHGGGHGGGPEAGSRNAGGLHQARALVSTRTSGKRYGELQDRRERLRKLDVSAVAGRSCLHSSLSVGRHSPSDGGSRDLSLKPGVPTTPRGCLSRSRAAARLGLHQRPAAVAAAAGTGGETGTGGGGRRSAQRGRRVIRSGAALTVC